MRTRRHIGVLVVALAALGLGALPAAAGTKTSAETIVRIYGIGSVGNDRAIAIGSVNSPKSKCLGARKVSVGLLEDNGDTYVFDVARTSVNGAWGSTVRNSSIPPASYVALTATAKAKTVALGAGKKLVCKRATKQRPLN